MLKNTDLFIQNAIDFHCHGIGKFDFTVISELRLDEIENILAQRKHKSILTLYLPEPNFEDFLYFMEIFYNGKRLGKYQHIVGISLEGPILASIGGTPREGIWRPTKRQWIQIANCGKKGLVYVVLSPDAKFDDISHSHNTNTPPTTITWIAETLLDNGVLPAPGHFLKSNPAESAHALQNLFDIVKAWGGGATITDHFLNDMPHNFKHAWRSPEEKLKRTAELASLDLNLWNMNSLEKQLGLVPAVMIKNALAGHVKICQNFDGEHVDLEIIKKSVEFIGAENMLMMTDSIESKILAGRILHQKKDSGLLYQNEGIVAAGSQSVQKQIENMFLIGLSNKEIELITDKVPSQLLKQQQKYCHEQNKIACL